MIRIKVERFKEDLSEHGYVNEREKQVIFEQLFEEIELKKLIKNLNSTEE